MYKFVLHVRDVRGERSNVVVVYGEDEDEINVDMFARNKLVTVLEKRRIERIDLFV